MAFLDNSGDIILDAVLTDAGRQRLARGNFKIVKFALGDEEINYSTFNGSHPSGSAFYDLEVMQTPILEAFTNNTSLMKSKLVTMTRNNILYMPIFKLNDDLTNHNRRASVNTDLIFDDYILLADKTTEQVSTDADFKLRNGLLRGAGSDTSKDETNHIAIDQGIDSNEGGISFKQPIPDDLVETAFLIRMDHRLLTLDVPSADLNSSTPLTNQFIDDDGIATYYVVQGDGTTAVEGAPSSRAGGVLTPGADGRDRANILDSNSTKTQTQMNEAFPGPVGSILRIYPRTSMHIRAGDKLFTEIGTTVASGTDLRIGALTDGTNTLTAYKYIDTLINIVGVTTGYSIDVPIRIVKKS